MNRADFLPYRQIHLDFHTSEAIEGIGADFDPDEFAGTLAKAHVNSITVFAALPSRVDLLPVASKSRTDPSAPGAAESVKGADRGVPSAAVFERRSIPRSNGIILRRGSMWTGC